MRSGWVPSVPGAYVGLLAAAAVHVNAPARVAGQYFGSVMTLCLVGLSVLIDTGTLGASMTCMHVVRS